MADAHKERVGAAILRRRSELGLSRAELARRLPVDVRTLYRWETGDSFGHMDNLEKLADALETTVDRLMAGPPQSKGATPQLDAVLNADIARRLDTIEQHLADLTERWPPELAAHLAEAVNSYLDDRALRDAEDESNAATARPTAAHRRRSA